MTDQPQIPPARDHGADRYARQRTLPEVGEAGQRRLAESSVLVIGLGGLGCPATTYLAGAGVGTLRLSDFDTVDTTNLHRQPLFLEADVGRRKTDAAAERLAAINPGVTIETLPERLMGPALDAAVSAGNLVLDCSDNFGTRFAVNAACVRAGVSLVSGAGIRFEGQLAVFRRDRPGEPCYRCLYDEQAETLENCTGAGVLGPVVGTVGAMMAVEALKLLLGAGEPAAGRLLVYDALAASWREFRIRRDPACPVCGTGAMEAAQTSATR